MNENNQARRRKEMQRIDDTCFICNERFEFYREVERHFKDLGHEENLKDFMRGMDVEKKVSKVEEQG